MCFEIAYVLKSHLLFRATDPTIGVVPPKNIRRMQCASENGL